MKLLTLIFTLHLALANYPGIRTSINIQSLNNLKSQFIPQILQSLTSKAIPSESFYFTALLIPCKMTLTDITIKEATVNMTGTMFYVEPATSQLHFLISELNMKVEANYRYNYPIFSSGQVEANFTGANLDIPVKLYIKNGVLYSEIYKTKFDRDTVSVKMSPSGSISKFFGFFIKYWPLQSISQYFYKSAIENASASYNSQLSQLLSTIDYNQDFTSIPISCDYHINSLTFDSSSIQLYFNATYYLTNNPGLLSPVLPPSFLPVFSTSNSLRLQFTEYFFDSLMWAMFASDSLNMQATSAQISKTFPFVFTTSGLNKIVPGMVTVYGPNIPVNLECSVYKIPDINIQATISAYLSFYCDFIVMVSPSAGTAAFRLLGRISTSFVGELTDIEDKVYLFGSFDETKTTFDSFSVVNSNIGSFNPSALQQAFNWQAYGIAIQLNRIFEHQGIEMPLPKGILLSKTDIEIYTGAMEIGAEISFSS